MKVIIKGSAKEIAALAITVQERQNTSAVEAVSEEMLTRLQRTVDAIYGRPIKISEKEDTC